VKHLPLLFEVRNKLCLVVGGGKIGTRRAQLLLDSGARIDLISISASEKISKSVEQCGGTFHQRAWSQDESDNNYALVIAATDDADLNSRIATWAKSHRIPVNVVTDSKLSDFSFPSVIDRDPLTIAVSSGSASPLLARLLGERIDSLIPASYGQLATLVGDYRKKVRAKFDDPDQRKAFWERILRGNVAEYIFSGHQDRARVLLENQLKRSESTPSQGEVYLIGAGPGDPDLLTFRAYRLLQQSEVVLYDRLVSQEILGQIDPDTEMIYVGKQRADHSVAQTEINQRLLDYALSGKRVARLKGGDPFIFGRGGEEIELLAHHQVPFQVVPGVTAASGCASYSGIPLTHRDHAQSVRFVTGQLRDGTVNLPWKQLVAPDQTVVIYMGLNGLPIISENLIHNGLSPETPAALIEQGTTLNQKVYVSTVKELPELINNVTIKPPTLMIIGSVVNLHASLNWFQPDSPDQ
jgi:uroporphyrin-III C-methyltransferase/precorrin-2 dehydrogenase/sirohydrochlorin ferrochelatase